MYVLPSVREIQHMKMTLPAKTCLPAILTLVCCTIHPSAQAFQDTVDFNRDIRPILSDACFTCHGPDKGQRQADLRLDQQEGLFRQTADSTVVAPGQPDKSELLARIETDDADLVMPPPDSGRVLTNEEKRLIRQWVVQGAEWKGHWAYLPLERPKVEDSSITPGSNEVDYFINSRLEQKGLSPSGRADAVSLARRLSLDLTGLPPSANDIDVQAFAASPSDEAWQKLVVRLLSSPHYGERMTALWLDLVRYADTNGIHGDNHREIWMYRDYVIDAFNSNTPFDRFTIEQIAGDLLPEPSDQQRIASGYNRLLMTTREGGAQPKEYLAKYSADRVRNVSSVWMGATMGCCECHDHKYDPYSIRDFYELAAFFADIQDVAVGVQPAVKMPSPQQKHRMSELDSQIQQLQKTIDTQTPELDQAMNTWVAELKKHLADTPRIWKVAGHGAVTSSDGQQLDVQPDSSVLASGPHPKHDTYTVAIPYIDSATVSGIRLEALKHDSMVKKSLSRGNGNYVLSEFSVGKRSSDESAAPQPIRIKEALADFEQKGWPVANALDNNPTTGWAVDGHIRVGEERVAVFRFETPVQLTEGESLIVTLKHSSVDFHNIGRFRLSTTATENPGLDDVDIGVPPSLVTVVEGWPEVEDSAKTALANHFRSITPVLEKQRNALASATQSRQQLEKEIPETLITRTKAPREIRVLARGNWMDDSGDITSPQVPHFLNQIEGQERLNRMDLAKWLVADDNPLVARVFVNRLWKMFFGKGIVSTEDDFGSQGSWPTHPELLDWLAIEFRESGWDVQHVIRLIVHSETYRRSSQFDEHLAEADPFNDLLARQSRFRLDAEFIRDYALAVSGLLVTEVGGRSVKPYQPEGYWDHLNFPKRKWQADAGDQQYRRGLYTYWCRTFLHPAMKAFDAPTREECTVTRPRSNNSLQALVLLNDPTFVEAARALAVRVLTDGGSNDAERISSLYDIVLSRPPLQQEREVLLELLAHHRESFADDETRTQQFLSVGQYKQSTVVNPQQLAAWSSVARTVMNLHETITRP